MRLQHTITLCVFLAALPVYLFVCGNVHIIIIIIIIYPFVLRTRRVLGHQLDFPLLQYFTVQETEAQRGQACSGPKSRLEHPLPGSALALSLPRSGVFIQCTHCCVCVCPGPEEKAHQVTRCAESKAAGGSGLPAPRSRLVWGVIWPAHRPRLSAHRR